MSTVAFKDWFSGSKVVTEDGQPRMVYRGEHGATADGELQTVLGNYTFSECPDVASTYAMRPNDFRLKPEQSRVVPAYLAIHKPVLSLLDDPFAELGDLEQKLGREFMTRMAIKHDGHVENTNNWQEDVGVGYDTVETFLHANPDGLSRLYMNAYPLLDDPEFVKASQEAGYDGAMHVGNGESYATLEFRVFERSQIRFAASCPEARASKALDFLAGLDAPTVAQNPGI